MKRDDIPKIGKVMTMGKSIKITSGLLLVGMLGILCACQSKDIESMKTATTVSEGGDTHQQTASTVHSKTPEKKETAYKEGSLLAAVKENNYATVKEILTTSDFYIDEVDKEGNSPLLVATRENFVEIAKLLIDNGANVNQQNNMQDSAYLFAGAEGRYDILDYMIKHTKPNQKVFNRFGGNALIPAAEKGHIDNVELLLKDDHIDINHQNNPGYTALIEAVALNDGSKLYQEISKLLLEHGADKTLRDQSGKTAADYATEKGLTEMSDLLSRY